MSKEIQVWFTKIGPKTLDIPTVAFAWTKGLFGWPPLFPSFNTLSVLAVFNICAKPIFS